MASKQSFIRAALSSAGEPSSKRVLACLAFLVSVLLICLQIIFPTNETFFTHCFDSLLMFSAASLGGTVIEAFKKQDTLSV